MAEVFNIDFEGGNLAGFTSTSGAGLSASADAAMAGTNYGLKVVISSTTAQYGALTFTNSTTGKIRVRFYVDPNAMTMASNDEFYLLYCYATAAGGNSVCNVSLRWSGSVYQLKATLIDDAATTTSQAGNITDAPHYIEFQLTRASSNVASDARLDWWIDGLAQTSITGKDLYDRFSGFNNIRAGAVGGLDAGTSGTLFIDQIVGNNDGSEIGPYTPPSSGLKIPIAMHYDSMRRN